MIQNKAMSIRFFRLTRPAIRRLKPGDRITEHGITAERLADGDTRISVNIMVDGERIHRVIGRESDGTTRTQAEAFIERARTEAREQRLSLPSGRKLHLVFAEAAKLYLHELKEVDGKDYANNEQHLQGRRQGLRQPFNEQHPMQGRAVARPAPHSNDHGNPSTRMGNGPGSRWLDFPEQADEGRAHRADDQAVRSVR